MVLRHHHLRAGGGNADKAFQCLLQVTAFQVNLFRRVPSQLVAFAGRALQQGNRLIQRVNPRFAQNAAQAHFFFVRYRQLLNHAFQNVQAACICRAQFGQVLRQCPCFARAQFLQVERAARFRACTGQAMSAKRLHAHHRADNVAVHINIARFNVFLHKFHGAVDAAVDAVRERIAFAVDLFD